MPDLAALTDDALLDHLQRNAFEYFLQSANLGNGLVADTTRKGAPASMACSSSVRRIAGYRRGTSTKPCGPSGGA